MIAVGVQTDSEENKDRMKSSISTIYEEQTFQEYKDKYLFKFEQAGSKLNKKELLKFLLGRVPLYVLSFFFLESCYEQYAITYDNHLMDQQRMEYLNNLRD
jgi:hypothetical protein